MDNTPINLRWPYGRFANSIFVIAFAKYIQSTGAEVRLVTDPDDSPAYGRELIRLGLNKGLAHDFEKTEFLTRLLLRNSSPEESLAEINNRKNATTIFETFAQFRTNLFRSTPNYLEGMQSLFAEGTLLGKCLSQGKVCYRRRSYLGLHLRRGDYVNSEKNHEFMYTLEASELPRLIDVIHNNLPASREMDIYLATDDKEIGSGFLEAVPPPTNGAERLGAWIMNRDAALLTQIGRVLPFHSDEFRELIHDFVMLCNASIMVTSNSSFSVLASLQNSSATRFFQYLPDAEGLLEFDPFDRPVLLRARGLKL